jgi:hypothetical protein
MGADDLAHLVLVDPLAVLGGHHHRRRPHRLAVHVLERDLALGVGADVGGGSGVPGFGQRPQDAVGVIDGSRHEDVRLAAGEAEHDALVARALVLVAAGVHAAGDVGRLRVDVHVDLGVLPVKPLLLVSDLPHRVARHLDQVVLGDRLGAAHLAGEDDAIGGRHRLDRDAGEGVGGHIGVDDGIGDSVANLVRMTFGHGFAGEDVVALRQSRPLK